MPSGYSGTLLAKKLGVKSAYIIYLCGAPKHYLSLFSELPSNQTFRKRIVKGQIDFIHMFCRSALKLLALAKGIMKRIC